MSLRLKFIPGGKVGLSWVQIVWAWDQVGMGRHSFGSRVAATPTSFAERVFARHIDYRTL